MEHTSEIYLKAFNNGYLLAKHQIDLLEKILLTNSENDYITGLKDGKGVFEIEKNKSRRLNEIKHIQSRDSRDKGLER